MASKAGERRLLSLSDLHYPYHDAKVWRGALQFARDYRPDVLVLNGDGLDFYDLSSFDRDPARSGRLAEEIAGFQAEILSPLVAATPRAKRYYMEGNHEHRFRRYLWRHAREIASLKGLQHAGEVLGLEKLGYEWREADNPLQVGHLLILHGHMLRRHSGATAKAHFERYGTSLLHGHSHRLGEYMVRDWRGVHSATEQGCLCNLHPEYDPHPNWQQGFAVVHAHKDDTFSVQVVKVINRQCFMFGEQRYALTGSEA